MKIWFRILEKMSSDTTKNPSIPLVSFWWRGLGARPGGGGGGGGGGPPSRVSRIVWIVPVGYNWGRSLFAFILNLIISLSSSKLCFEEDEGERKKNSVSVQKIDVIRVIHRRNVTVTGFLKYNWRAVEIICDTFCTIQTSPLTPLIKKITTFKIWRHWIVD